MDCRPTGSSVPGIFPGKNNVVGCHSLLQGIFPTEGLNPGFLHCRQILYHLSYQGSPNYWVNLLNLPTFLLDMTLCEEAFFRFAVPTKLTPNWLSVLVDNLPGTKVNAESVERIKQRHNSREQTFQLLKLWKHQNKDQDMVKKIIQGMVAWTKQLKQKSEHLLIIQQKWDYVPVGLVVWMLFPFGNYCWTEIVFKW